MTKAEKNRFLLWNSWLLESNGRMQIFGLTFRQSDR
jgi:hypothetical protein